VHRDPANLVISEDGRTALVINHHGSIDNAEFSQHVDAARLRLSMSTLRLIRLIISQPMRCYAIWIRATLALLARCCCLKCWCRAPGGFAATPDGRHIIVAHGGRQDRAQAGNTIAIVVVELAVAGSPQSEVARVKVGTNDPAVQTHPLIPSVRPDGREPAFVQEELLGIQKLNKQHNEASNQFVHEHAQHAVADDSTSISSQLNSNREINHAVKILLKATSLWYRDNQELGH